jgi:hypothetical protein
MRFRSELLQPPSDDSEATLRRIYDVYRTPSGSIEGDGEDIGEVLECSDAAIRKGVCSNEVSKKRER